MNAHARTPLTDEAVLAYLDRALESVRELVRQLDRIEGHTTHNEQADLRKARALLAECGR